MSTALDEERGTIVKTEQIRVREIEKGGLGESALKVGDVIRSITVGERTVKVTRMHHVIDSLLAGAAGDAVKIAITRNGVEQEVSFTLTTACLTAY
jgi:C-terminal processing protease CtpA/Prc